MTNDGIIDDYTLDDARVLGLVTFMVKEIPRVEGKKTLQHPLKHLIFYDIGNYLV